MEARTGPLSILVVCDGNVCRSPTAEFLLGIRLPHARIESAGMHARAGALMCDVASASISAVDPRANAFARDFRSRRVSDLELNSFDLVLTATTQLRGDLARLHPDLRDRFFTMREAAGVLVRAGLEGEQAGQRNSSSLIQTMNRFRGVGAPEPKTPASVRRITLDPLDIPDAHASTHRRHRAVIELALSSAGSIGDSLRRLPIK